MKCKKCGGHIGFEAWEEKNGITTVTRVCEDCGEGDVEVLDGKDGKKS